MKTRLLTFILLSLCSCVGYKELDNKSDIINNKSTNKDSSLVVFNFFRDPPTKSSIQTDETKINNINLYIFRDGYLVLYKYIDGSSPISLTLPRGYTYNLYALGNFGEYLGETIENNFIKNCSKTINNISELNTSLPMAWCKKGLDLSSTYTSLSINLERLVAKVGFRLDKSSISEITITSIQLKQSPNIVFPFRWEEGSKVVNASEVFDGDYSSTNDLNIINNGGAVYFYTFENCQGTLLLYNEDPWAKIPSNINSNYLTSTYLEVKGSFKPESPFDGNVIYRLFLGEDNCSNFDVRRNKDMDISLKLTNYGLGENSWKVETDISFRNGFTIGWVDESNREIDDQYIGNAIFYGAEVDYAILEYLGGSLEGCEFILISNNGAQIQVEDYYSYSNYIEARLICTQAGTGSLWLYSPNGEAIQNLSSEIKIQVPEIKLSLASQVAYNDNNFEIDENLSCCINGGESKIHVYLTDKDGYNLNTGYEYHLYLFDFTQSPTISSNYDIQECINVTMSPGVESSNGPVVTYSIECINPGTDSNKNENLADAYGSLIAYSFDIEENQYLLNKNVAGSLNIEPIDLVLVDNGWAEYFDSQLSLKVRNSSNLPLDISIWQAHTTNDKTNIPLRNTILNYVENFLTINRTKYSTNTFYNGASDLYASYCYIKSENNNNGSEYILDGDFLVHPLRSIKTSDLHYSIVYDYLGQNSLHHLFDVKIASSRISSSLINVCDSLSDGSMQFEVIYGSDPESPGWNNQGIWMSSNGFLIQKPNNTLDIYSNISTINMTKLSNRLETNGIYELQIQYNFATGTLQARSLEGNKYNISLDFRYSGSVEGYVKTYPNGIKRPGKDNYCRAMIYKTVSGVNVSSAYIDIDSGAVKEGVDAIYAQTFFDTYSWYNASNNYQHHAHPTSIDLQVEVKLSDGTDWYPIDLIFLNSNINYLHSQDNTTYSVSFNPYLSSFSFNKVEKSE